MIISQTPLRIGLIGGGTDLVDYYRVHGGRVINFAIDKYVYVIVKERFDEKIYLNYSRKEIVDRREEIQHELIREAMMMSGILKGVEITTLADIPSEGSGLGSSAAITVGLLNALFQARGIQLSARELAEKACEIEMVRLARPVGKQDQYIAAYGGIRDLRFGPGEAIAVDSIALSASSCRELERRMMLFYSGVTRKADSILEQQRRNIDSQLEQLHILKGLAERIASNLAAEDFSALGAALTESWAAKRQLAENVSNAHIDEIIGRALDAGAEGAKVCGAGGGGFVLLLCPMEHQTRVRSTLSGYRELPIRIDRFGSRVILNTMGV
jgi:D-glycero-alpha-D-manno-heptose-7-phosphate kinase